MINFIEAVREYNEILNQKFEKNLIDYGQYEMLLNKLREWIEEFERKYSRLSQQ